MSWSSVSATVLPLAGVVLGGGGALLGQRMALRVEVRRDDARRVTEQRAERKDAIIGFLGATERVEAFRGQLREQFSHDVAHLTELMQAVWLAKKIIEIVCSGALAQAAQNWTLELNGSARDIRQHGLTTARTRLSGRERQLRAEFMEAARREMGYTGEPLQARTYAEAAQMAAGVPTSQEE